MPQNFINAKMCRITKKVGKHCVKRFMSNQDHEAQKIFDELMKFLTTHDIDLQNCESRKTAVVIIFRKLL